MLEKTLEVADILSNIRNCAIGNYYDPLFKKQGLYFGSIYKKALATYKNTCGMVPQGLIINVHDSLYLAILHVGVRHQ